MATPEWLAIANDEISLRLNPNVVEQIDLDTKGLANYGLLDRAEIIYKFKSQELLQVLASSVGIASLRQGAIVIWTYYTESTETIAETISASVSSSPSLLTESPILRTLMNIDGDLCQKICQDILYHPQADRILKAHSFIVSQISRQFLTAIVDYVEEKLRPFAIAMISFVTTITWCDPLRDIGKRLSWSPLVISLLTNPWMVAIAAPITVLSIWWIFSRLNIDLPTLPKFNQKLLANLLQILESPVFRFIAIAAILTLLLCWVALLFLQPINGRFDNLIQTFTSYLEPYLPLAIISLRKGIVSVLGQIFLRYPFFVKLIFGRFIR
ncbi:hypothetical protein [Pseudanabaena sp. 'Roaring Creek']|uniref:hypothetical protein n=1 Tax=Pseudanabaena sp. 'Roaring Creek' TaxID=1681830 RepID=UPI0006D7F03B|nr:hypothetical protein [Pseudanabaena sp. 'Roaring Creek']